MGDWRGVEMKSIEEIIEGLDGLFSEQRMSEVEPYLQNALKEAMETGRTAEVKRYE